MGDKIGLVNFWRGTRSAYNAIGLEGKLDYWTRYTVNEPDGRRTEYFGATPVTQVTGELSPVIDIVETLPATLNIGDRYLVGAGSEYYIVEIAANRSLSSVSPIGDLSVRVKSKNYWRYQVVDGTLQTIDGIIDCGTF